MGAKRPCCIPTQSMGTGSNSLFLKTLRLVPMLRVGMQVRRFAPTFLLFCNSLLRGNDQNGSFGILKPVRNFCYLVFIAAGILAGCGNDDKKEFTASGIVEGTSVKVGAQTGGCIQNIYFEEGEDVQKGLAIAAVDTEKLAYQLEQTQAAIEELGVQRQINLNALSMAKTEHDHIEKKYRRYLDLYEKNSASRQVLDDLKAAYDTRKTALQNARQSIAVVGSKQKGLAAQEKLLQRQINDATIVAPLSGTITTKYFEPGEMIPTGAPIVEIIDLSRMWTKVYISEKMLARIEVGQDAEIRIDGTDKTLIGQVAWISPRAEFTPKSILTEESRTSLVYAVKVIVDNPDKILKHGMPVEIAVRYDRPAALTKL